MLEACSFLNRNGRGRGSGEEEKLGARAGKRTSGQINYGQDVLCDRIIYFQLKIPQQNQYF